MTKPDQAIDEAEDARDFTDIKRLILGSIGGFSLVFLVAVLVGYSTATLENRIPDLYDFIVIGTLLALIAAITWAMWRFWPKRPDEPEAQSVKSSRQLLYSAFGLGLILSIVMIIGTDSTAWIYGDRPVNPVAAGIALFGWLVLTPIGTWWWWRSVDEHEKDAYRDGAFITAHVYIFLCAGWWIATRAQWLPEQDPITIMLITCTVWIIVWLYKKYR